MFFVRADTGLSGCVLEEVERAGAIDADKIAPIIGVSPTRVGQIIVTAMRKAHRFARESHLGEFVVVSTRRRLPIAS
jgi:hypothetical protein